jgi:hypothetical protein
MKRIITLVGMLSMAGCGTIIHGTNTRVQLESTPSSMAVIDGTIKVRTPASIPLPNNKSHTISFEQDGCEAQTAYVANSFNAMPTILGNILWLLPGLAVDFIAGGAWHLEPNRVKADLVCLPKT